MNITGRASTVEAQQELLAVLGAYWAEHVGERLGQVLSNLAETQVGIALRYVEDQALLEAAQDILEALRLAAPAGGEPPLPSAPEPPQGALTPPAVAVDPAPPAPAAAAPEDGVGAPTATDAPPSTTGPAPDTAPTPDALLTPVTPTTAAKAQATAVDPGTASGGGARRPKE